MLWMYHWMNPAASRLFRIKFVIFLVAKRLRCSVALFACLIHLKDSLALIWNCECRRFSPNWCFLEESFFEDFPLNENTNEFSSVAIELFSLLGMPRESCSKFKSKSFCSDLVEGCIFILLHLQTRPCPWFSELFRPSFQRVNSGCSYRAFSA